MKRLVKLVDDTVRRMTGGVEAGACRPEAFTCCFTAGYEHNCYGNCYLSPYC